MNVLQFFIWLVPFAFLGVLGAFMALFRDLSARAFLLKCFMGACVWLLLFNLLELSSSDHGQILLFSRAAYMAYGHL